jgi:hypothetical protein
LCEGLRLQQRLGVSWNVELSLERFAGVAVRAGQPARAAQLLGAAEVLRETIGRPLTSGEGVELERNVAAVRTQLSATTFNAAWAAGRAFTWEQALAYALEDE